MTPQTLTTRSTPKTLREIESRLNRDPKLKSVNTKRGYLADLTAFENWRGSRVLSKLLVEDYAAHLQHLGRSPNSINRVLAAIRWWARKVADLALEDSTLSTTEARRLSEQALRAAVVKDVTGHREPKGRHLSTGELAALMQACAADTSPAGTRDAAIIALAWCTGLRRSELVGLTMADVKWTGDEEADLLVRGKGDKQRTIYIYDGCGAALRDWLAVRGDVPGPVFLRIQKGGKIIMGEAITADGLAKMLARRADDAGLSESATWHDFRRTFAGNLLDAGSDLVTVQKLLGHASPITTSNYDRRGEETKRKAVRVLHVPYHRRKE